MKIKLKLILLLLAMMAADCKQVSETRLKIEFMVQFIDTHIKYDELIYWKDESILLERERLIEILKSRKVYGIGSKDYISLSKNELNEISRGMEFKDIHYWRRTLFTKSTLNLHDRQIKLVDRSKYDRPWLFTEPVFIRNGKYCFFSYQQSGMGNYSVYKKDGNGIWKRFFIISQWTVG